MRKRDEMDELVARNLTAARIRAIRNRLIEAEHILDAWTYDQPVPLYLNHLTERRATVQRVRDGIRKPGTRSKRG